MTFKVVWDSGKPCEESCPDTLAVDKLIGELRYEADNFEYPYFDIWVYDESDRDVTDEFLK
jgi:hypothetical protein